MRTHLLLLLLFPLAISAQVVDNFNDANFSSSPTWIGDTASWTVTDGQLRSNSNTPSSNFYLSAASTKAIDCQWEFFVNLKFQTSSANYTDIYLMSDSANVKDVNSNGYFVRVGNTADEISLYKQLNGITTKIIDGVDASVSSSNNRVNIKVTRSTNHVWILSSNVNGAGFGYYTEGGISDSSIVNSNYFGVFIQQSSASFHNNHYYDNIYVGPIFTDTVAPIIARVKDVIINEIFADPSPPINLPAAEYIEIYNNSDQSLQLEGWKFTDGVSIATLKNYSLAPDEYLILCSKTDTALFGSYNNVMGLSSFPVLNNAGDYLYLKNEKSTTIDSVNYSSAWYKNEIKDGGGWSLELTNPTANANCPYENFWTASVNTNGGTPGSINSTIKAIDVTPPQLINMEVLTNSLIQLTFDKSMDINTLTNTRNISIDNEIGTPIQNHSSNAENTSIQLTLGTALSAGVYYSVSLSDSVTSCTGVSISTNSGSRFIIPETAMPNDIVINEILFNPYADGIDFVEIYNRSNKIIDLSTITVSQYDTINNTIMHPENIIAVEYLIHPNEYLLLSENGIIIKGQYGTENPAAFLDMDNLPTMSNKDGTVCLSTTNNIIDVIKYYEYMQFPLLNNYEGVSLERIHYDRASNDITNWHSAAETIGFATPGYENSQFKNEVKTEGDITIAPSIFSPDGDGVNDVVNINYRFDKDALTANITIFDSKGRLVKKLVENDLLGKEGTYSWDGINENREKEKVGIYIFLIETIELTGAVKHYKKTCVLAAQL